MSEEKHKMIEFEGFAVDLFLTTNGNLGLTVEKLPVSDDNHCVDIYVDKETLVVHSDRPAPQSGWITQDPHSDLEKMRGDHLRQLVQEGYKK